MTPRMNIVFEVENLASASPATVSRCGMIYLDPATCVGNKAKARTAHFRLSLQVCRPAGIDHSFASVQIQSWIKGIKDPFRDCSARIEELFERLFIPMLEHLRTDGLREYVPSVDTNIIDSMTSILSSFFAK